MSPPCTHFHQPLHLCCPLSPLPSSTSMTFGSCYHLTSPIRDPHCFYTAQLPQNANDMLSLHIQTKWHDLLQLQVCQFRNENVGVGRQSTVGEGLAQLPTDSQSCSDKDLAIVILFSWLYFSKMFFFFLVLFSGHQTSLQLWSPAAPPPPPLCCLLWAHVCFTWPLTPFKPSTV